MLVRYEGAYAATTITIREHSSGNPVAITDLSAVPTGTLLTVDVTLAYDTVRWMRDLGIVMEPAVSLSGVKVDGVVKFPSGAVIRSVEEGVGLSRRWFEIAEARIDVAIRREKQADAVVLIAEKQLAKVCITIGDDVLSTVFKVRADGGDSRLPVLLTLD